MILALHHPRRGFTSHGFLSEDGSAEICVDQIGGRYHRNCTLRVYDFAPRGRLIRIKRLNPSRD